MDIRPATPDDAPALSALIIRTLETSNALDYSAADIARTVSHFGIDDLRLRLADDNTQVAIIARQIVGTARIDPSKDGAGMSLRTFFVDPDLQGRGIGRALFDHLVRDVQLGTCLTVRSSLQGIPFYSRLGFAKLRDHWEGSEQTIVMERRR